MGKMHQLLAVEKDVLGRAAAILQETRTTFQKKAVEFYTGFVKTYKPFDDADKDLLPKEEKVIVDSVPDKLAYTAGILVEDYDFTLQKEMTNTGAAADLVVDGVMIGQKLPATFLLALESKLTKLRELIHEAPTLPTGIKWVPDPDTGKHVFKLAEPMITYRTRKTPYAFELAPATKEHKAQVVEKEKTETVGAYTEMRVDSRVTSAQKAEWLDRVDKLLVAVRKAVRTANDIEASNATIGQNIFNFVLGPQ
jgi:hypothetical protein